MSEPPEDRDQEGGHDQEQQGRYAYPPDGGGLGWAGAQPGRVGRRAPLEGVQAAIVAGLGRLAGIPWVLGGAFMVAVLLGDLLVVCLNSDDSVRRLKGPERPIVPVDDRAAVLSALSCVDAVAVFDEDTPVALLERLRPDVFVKGGDYRVEELPETPVLAGWGGRVVTVPLVAGRSTTAILQEVRHRAG